MDMKKKLLFVFNPCSGKAQIKNQLLDIVDTMVKADYEVTIYPTQCAGDAKEKVEAYAGNYDLVVCSGGDGTLDEVVTGMMQCKAKVPLGYIPAGSTNDFASSLGIPKDMEKAAEAAVIGKPFPCDVGLFNGDYFVYVAAFGLFTEVSYKTSQEWKNVLGHAAYILEGAKCLHDIPSFMMQVEYNNMRIQDEFIYGMITNSTSVGGFKGMTGKDVLLEIEIQGALQVKEKRPDTLLVFITPPTAEELERRLRGRGTETEEVIKGRMERAKEEAQGMDQYDYVLINDDLETCVKQMHETIQSQHFMSSNQKDFIEQMKKSLEK